LALLSRDSLDQGGIGVEWQTHYVDRQIQATVTRLFGPEPDAAFVRLVRRKVPNLSRRDLADGLRRARIRFDFPRAASKPTLVATGGRDKRTPPAKLSSARVTVRDLIAAGILIVPIMLRCTYKGRALSARIEREGDITFEGTTYASLSTAAGMARRGVIGAPPGRKYPQTNGWTFWRYVDAEGIERPIDHLRHQYVATT
jgi:hypothetical protein